MEIVKGRPLNVKERLKKEVRVYDLLDELDIEYWRIDHEVAQTMEDCEEVEFLMLSSVKICFYVIVRKQNFIFS